MDHYKVLGVSRTASQDEIKQSYRKMAMKHHPDRGGDVEQFKRINEAYDVLKDTTKRSQYDQPQPQPQNNFDFRSQNFAQGRNPFAGSPFEDFFNRYQGGNAGGFKGKDITVRVIIDLKDIITGKAELVQYRLQNGAVETVSVEIPAGARQGDTIRYDRLGDITDARLPRGDLYVKVHIREPHNWSRDGNNIVTKRKINVFDILLGCVILIETLDQKRVSLTVPKGTKIGTILSIPGYGIPDLRTKKKGNMYIQIDVEIPKITDLAVLSKVEELKKMIEEKK